MGTNAFWKVPGYKQLDKAINPHRGFDMEKLRNDLLKMKDELGTEVFDAKVEELRQKWYQGEYAKLCLQEKLDMSLDQFVQLMHSQVEKWATKEMPMQAISLLQSIMKDQNEKAKLAIEFAKVQLARDIHESNKVNASRNLAGGFINIDIEKELQDGNEQA